MLENLKDMLVLKSEGTLYHSVATDLMDSQDNNEDFICHIKDVINYGCSSGCVSSQIYYKDTDIFFNDHKNEIFDMLNDYIKECGNVTFEINANNLSWFAYEKVAMDIALDLGIDC